MTQSSEHPPYHLSPETIRFGNTMLAVEGVLLFCGVIAAITLTIRDARRARRKKDLGS